jgi:hypothetical protein
MERGCIVLALQNSRVSVVLIARKKTFTGKLFCGCDGGVAFNQASVDI